MIVGSSPTAPTNTLMTNPYPDFKPRKWIYIAGPYTNPDPVLNTRNAILAGQRMYEAGLFPVIPHLSLLHHLVIPQPLEFWYNFDLNLLTRCDALLRLPGASTGSDKEVDFAEHLSIPVFYDESQAILYLSRGDVLCLEVE